MSTGGLTDKQFLRRVLDDGMPHSQNEILRLSFAERGCGLTVHSRAAELRADVRGEGGDVLNWRDGQRGNHSWYRLVLLREPAVSTAPVRQDDGHDAAGSLSGGQPVGYSAVTGTGADVPADPVPVGPAQLTLEVAA